MRMRPFWFLLSPLQHVMLGPDPSDSPHSPMDATLLVEYLIIRCLISVRTAHPGGQAMLDTMKLLVFGSYDVT
jgi:hypothetical protein